MDIEEKTTGATIHDHDFEVDYNEESDEDWAEGNESVHSETSSTFEMFHSATFGPAGEDVTSVDYEEPSKLNNFDLSDNRMIEIDVHQRGPASRPRNARSCKRKLSN